LSADRIEKCGDVKPGTKVKLSEGMYVTYGPDCKRTFTGEGDPAVVRAEEERRKAQAQGAAEAKARARAYEEKNRMPDYSYLQGVSRGRAAEIIGRDLVRRGIDPAYVDFSFLDGVSIGRAAEIRSWVLSGSSQPSNSTPSLTQSFNPPSHGSANTAPIPKRIEPPPVIVNCDQAGCWDTSGKRYNHGAGPTFFRSDGKTCTGVPGFMHCN
jgi:hypothetical protein